MNTIVSKAQLANDNEGSQSKYNKETPLAKLWWFSTESETNLELTRFATQAPFRKLNYILIWLVDDLYGYLATF